MTDQTDNPYDSQLRPEVAKGTESAALNPPIINYPQQNSKHASGYTMLAGKNIRGATVHILDSNNNIWREASVNGETWQLLHNWGVGKWPFKAGQSVNGVTSYPSPERSFIVSIESDAPVIAAPMNDSRHQAGNVAIVVACDPAASAVRILSYDDSQLGVAKKLMHGIWGYERTWDRGAKHVKAVATVNGKESSRSSMIQFFVE